MNEYVFVRYTAKKYKDFFGDNIYKAKPYAKYCYSGFPSDYRITDKEGDLYTVCSGALHEGLREGWELV